MTSKKGTDKDEYDKAIDEYILKLIEKDRTQKEPYSESTLEMLKMVYRKAVEAGDEVAKDILYIIGNT